MDSAGSGPPTAAGRVSRPSGGAHARLRRRWLIGAGAFWLLVAASAFFLHGWLLGELVGQAARRGVALAGCGLDLGLSSVTLSRCNFALRPDARVLSPALTEVAGSGSVEQIEVALDGLSPERLRLRGARLQLTGAPRWAELARPGAGSSLPAAELPLDIERGALVLAPAADEPPVLRVDDVSLDGDARRLAARFEVVRRAHGQLSAGPEGLEATLGDPARPEVRLIVRLLHKAQRVDVSLDLRELPLRTLEGPWLQMTDALRPVELDGRVFASIPLGLTLEPPAGDLYLTLNGLQFPVPREVEGLIHQTPPKLSGKFVLDRTLDRATFAELSFLTGELAMRGGAEVEIDGRGLSIATRSSGPLACRAIAESAATAHAGSVLGALAGRFARRAITGSVEVVAAIEAHTSDLEHAKVFTSIGVGCGLVPLPVEPSVSPELLGRLPIDLLPAPLRPERPRATKQRRSRATPRRSSPGGGAEP